MKKTKTDERMLDEQLVDFTDKLLKNTSGEDPRPSALDPQLRALQKTALRLKNTFPKDGPSEAAIQRMRQNIIQQWKRQEQKSKAPFWTRILPWRISNPKKWQSQRHRQNWSLVAYLVTAVIFLLVSIPSLNKISYGQPAASGQNLGFSIYIAFGGLILLAILFFRRRL